jgi:hypothetical protein
VGEAGGILVACVAENDDRFYNEARNLVLSVRRFGGELGRAPVVVCFVDGVDPRYEKGLAELDADVEVVTRFDPRTPASNKLRMLELAETRSFDVLLAIDTDTVVLGDVSTYADASAVAVKPENRDPYTIDVWRQVYTALDITEPSRSMVTTSTGQLTYPYFNSGVLFVPHGQCHVLYESWAERVFEVLDLYERRPDIVPAPERHWTNQLALALVAAGDGIPIVGLPVAANLSTTVEVHPLFAHEVTPPFVLHYHNELDADGFVFRSRHPSLNPLIDEFNRARAETFAIEYPGLPDPPLVRRALRRVEGRAWYEGGPVAYVRRHRLLAPVRRQAKRLAKGRG